MTVKYYFILLLLCIFSSSISSQTVIQGQVKDKDGGVIGASVFLLKEEVNIKAVPTDFDGNYIFQNIDPGTYNILVKTLGLVDTKITGIIVRKDSITVANIQLSDEYFLSDEVCIRAYKVPLIDFDQMSTVQTITSEDIFNSPLKSNGKKAETAGELSSDNKNIKIRGNRKRTKNKLLYGVRVDDLGLIEPTKTGSNESYKKIEENNFENAYENALSTLSIDVDRASYSNMRRFVVDGTMPPVDAIRTEELINYFPYDYKKPTKNEEHPFVAHTELTDCPWNKDHQLLHIGIQGKDIEKEDIPPSNLVFLIDVSGSMKSPKKLPLLISSFELLVAQLRPEDRVAIVVYASASGLVLESTSGENKNDILESLHRLRAGGSTAGGQGIKQAYNVAKENFMENGNNRVILATDGDFNVGISSNDELLKLIEKERESGIFLSVLAFGTGNYQDDKMQILTDAGNGNHSYIDNREEAKKVFEEEFGGTLFTIAKDVKIQIEFNPFLVEHYRMIGYENRKLNAEDFNDDKKDAGEMGANHSVTVIYEIVPRGTSLSRNNKIDKLRYKKETKKENKTLTKNNKEIGLIKFRYKEPDEDISTKTIQVIANKKVDYKDLNEDQKWAIQVATFGQLLRKSKYNTAASYDGILEALDELDKKDKYREEFVELVGIVKELDKEKGEGE